jgi:hypothetical protein
MGQTAKPTRQNRTLTVDFHDETTYLALLDNTQAFVAWVLAFILSIGFQLTHKASCSEGGRRQWVVYLSAADNCLAPKTG